MNESDKPQFINMVTATLELYGRRYTMPETYELWFESMRQFDYGAIRGAMQEHALGGKGQAPVPADIIRILQSRDGHPGVEEAWSIVSKTLSDESVTVFWTGPMQRAFGVALELADDPVAARMAFREVYTRELADTRERGVPVEWQISPGTDKGMRAAAVQEALRLGRIHPDYAQLLLPPPKDRGEPIGGLLVKSMDEQQA